MSCFQNKTALAKISKDVVVQSNGHISVLTFLAFLVTLTVLTTTLTLNLFSMAPLTSLYSDFLLASLDALLLSLF